MLPSMLRNICYWIALSIGIVISIRSLISTLEKNQESLFKPDVLEERTVVVHLGWCILEREKD